MTEPGFAGLVIRRSPDREERQLRLSRIYAILAVATLAAVVIGVAVSIGIAMYSGPGFASVGWELALPCGLAISTIIAV